MPADAVLELIEQSAEIDGYCLNFYKINLHMYKRRRFHFFVYSVSATNLSHFLLFIGREKQ